MQVQWVNGRGEALTLQDPYRLVGADGLFAAAPATVHTRRGVFQRGATWVATRATVRKLTLRLMVRAGGIPTGTSRLAQLAGAFDPEAGPGTLRVTRDDGVVRWLDCVVVTLSDAADPRGMAGALLVTVELDALSPDWYDPTPRRVWFVGQGSALSLPVALPVALTTPSPAIGEAAVISYPGTAPTPVRIVLFGQASAPIVVIRNGSPTGGGTLRFLDDVPADGVLSIDTRPTPDWSLATAGTIYPRQPRLAADSTFAGFWPGENTVLISAAQPHPGGLGYIEYVARYRALGDG